MSFATPAINAVSVKLSTGNDRVVLNNVRPANDLFLEMKEGNDRVELNNVDVGKNLIAELGTGADQLTATNLIVGEDANIKAETAATATLNTANIGKGLTYAGASGNDVLTATALTMGGDFNANTDKGDDRIELTGGDIGGGVVEVVQVGEGPRRDGVPVESSRSRHRREAAGRSPRGVARSLPEDARA